MKASEFRELTKDELDQRNEEIRQEYFNLQMQKVTGQLEKPSRLKELRRDIARIKTVLHEREREDS